MSATRDGTIRAARPADAAELARLSGELGYPVTTAEMQRRLTLVLASPNHYVAVVASGDRLLAWVGMERRVSLEGGERAELIGLIVDATARRGGWGRALVKHAEQWTVAQGLTSLVVRSNTARDQSHPFYEAIDYSRDKTQHVYVRELRRARA
jgi:GNAT superfamily N-acetyltransferase